MVLITPITGKSSTPRIISEMFIATPTNSDEDYNWSWCSWFDCKFFRDFGLLIEGGHIKGSST